VLALAKPALDVGLFTNRWDEMQAFYVDGLGLPYEELLPIGGGVRQHRLGLAGGVLKINDCRDPLDDGPTGYAGLLLADATVAEPVPAVDPDGLDVVRVPPGYRAVTAAAVGLGVADPAAFDRFFTDALGADVVGEHAYRLGSTVLLVRHDPLAERAAAMRTRGFHYLTVQVRDVVGEHQRLLDLGVEEGAPPRKLGAVAMVSFVRDPGGNWIEISQRASLTGPLPPG
jgi:lactoylglutathione lyase